MQPRLPSLWNLLHLPHRFILQPISINERGHCEFLRKHTSLWRGRVDYRCITETPHHHHHHQTYSSFYLFVTSSPSHGCMPPTPLSPSLSLALSLAPLFWKGNTSLFSRLLLLLLTPLLLTSFLLLFLPPSCVAICQPISELANPGLLPYLITHSWSESRQNKQNYRFPDLFSCDRWFKSLKTLLGLRLLRSKAFPKFSVTVELLGNLWILLFAWAPSLFVLLLVLYFLVNRISF